MRERSKQAVVAIALLMFVAGGCAYSTKNALPKHMKTIAVPVFTNKTYIDEYTRKLEVELTEATRNAFIQAGELKIAGREDADLILEGAVMKLDREVLRSDRFGEPAEVRLVVRARISVYDVKEAKYLFKDQLVTNTDKKTEAGVYNLRRGQDEAAGRGDAITELGRAIARRVTERW
jgi:hypothetical protein